MAKKKPPDLGPPAPMSRRERKLYETWGYILTSMTESGTVTAVMHRRIMVTVIRDELNALIEELKGREPTGDRT